MYVNKGSVTAIGIIFPVFAAIALTLRIYAIKLLRRGMNIDDILIIPATVSSIPEHAYSTARRPDINLLVSHSLCWGCYGNRLDTPE